MHKRSLVAVAALGFCVGCGPAEPQPAAPTPNQDSRQRIQVLKADCMKGKGFRYVPWTPPLVVSEAQRARLSTGYEGEKAYRSKYGFGLFSMLVYPAEMGLRDTGDGPADPNHTIKYDLSPAQQEAYTAASESCEVQAIKQVTGKVVKSVRDWFAQSDMMVRQRATRDLDGDPELVALASAMADCLSAKGYQVTSTRPTAVSEWGAAMFRKEMHELARKEGDDIPEYQPDQQTWYAPVHLAPGAARRHLDREIKVALDELECGKDFYAAFLPRQSAISQQFGEESGLAHQRP